jgi:hypothetical protein
MAKRNIFQLLTHIIPQQKFDARTASMLMSVSHGMPPPSRKLKFKVKGGKKILLPAPTGHPLNHLYFRGHELVNLLNGKAAGIKSAFWKRDEMASALAHMLNTPDGILGLEKASNGERITINSESDLTPILIAWGPQHDGVGGYARVDDKVLTQAGLIKLKTVAVVEMRERNKLLYPHIHTFYPKLTNAELQSILQVLNAPKYQQHVTDVEPGTYTEEELILNLAKDSKV